MSRSQPVPKVPPPVGLRPRRYWLEERRDEIIDAIVRYRSAAAEVPTLWTSELRELDVEIERELA